MACNAGSPFDTPSHALLQTHTYAGMVRLVGGGVLGLLRCRRQVRRRSQRSDSRQSAWGVAGAARAVAVLVVATTPPHGGPQKTLVGGLSRAARRGVLIKGGGVLQRLADVLPRQIPQDRTLTTGLCWRRRWCGGRHSLDGRFTWIKCPLMPVRHRRRSRCRRAQVPTQPARACRGSPGQGIRGSVEMATRSPSAGPRGPERGRGPRGRARGAR